MGEGVSTFNIFSNFLSTIHKAKAWNRFENNIALFRLYMHIIVLHQYKLKFKLRGTKARGSLLYIAHFVRKQFP